MISAPFIVQIPKAGNPAVALGISMQTLAGLVVAYGFGRTSRPMRR